MASLEEPNPIEEEDCFLRRQTLLLLLSIKRLNILVFRRLHFQVSEISVPCRKPKRVRQNKTEQERMTVRRLIQTPPNEHPKEPCEYAWQQDTLVSLE